MTNDEAQIGAAHASPIACSRTELIAFTALTENGMGSQPENN
jgi:hypothetical protein